MSKNEPVKIIFKSDSKVETINRHNQPPFSTPSPPRLSELASTMLANKRFAGKKCLICHGIIKLGEKISLCEECKTTSHYNCWEENGGCGVYGCKKSPNVDGEDFSQHSANNQQYRSSPQASHQASPDSAESEWIYATFGDRAAAYIIDALILTLPLILVSLIFGNIISILTAWIYFALLESSKQQGTIGKRAMGVKVADNEGNRISFIRASGRYFAKYLSAVLFGAGFFMALFTEKRQCLHDLIAECISIKITT